VAQFVYIDEIGIGKKQPLLTVVAVVVDEEMVQPLSKGLRKVAWKHLGWVPADLEFHGNELWQRTKHWEGKGPSESITAYEDALGLLDTYDIGIGYSTIDKAELHAQYNGAHDGVGPCPRQESNLRHTV
jgi:hypothetical protein